MSAAPDLVLLAELRAVGLNLTPLPDGRVNVTPRANLTPALRGRILEAKPALLAALELDRRIRAMGNRWSYSFEDVEMVLGWAKEDPAVWLQAVAADERIHCMVVEVNQ